MVTHEEFGSFPWNPLRKAHHESKFKTKTLKQEKIRSRRKRMQTITIYSQLSFPQAFKEGISYCNLKQYISTLLLIFIGFLGSSSHYLIKLV